MTHFPITRLPTWPVGGASPDALLRDITDWTESAAMTALVRAFGGDLPSGDTGARLAYLDDFSTVWDARRGGERSDARHVDHDEQTRDLVEAAAPALGLAGRHQPVADRYDHVLVLGGSPVTGRARARFAADLLAGRTTGTVTGLGSLRPIPPMSTHDSDGPDGPDSPGDPVERTEGDAMLVAVQAAFPPVGEATERAGTTPDGNGWWVKTYPSATGPVSVLAAPPTRPGQRANTADTLLGWAGLVTQPTADDHILLVTTDLYVPFQHAEAINALGLPHRCGIDTVGFDTRSFHAWPKGPAHTGELLQELRSAIRSMRALHRHALRVQR